MTQRNYPITIDLDAEGEKIEREGIRGPFGQLTVYPTNWPKNKPVPESEKIWLKKGLADGSIVLGGEMDPRFL